MYLVMGSRSVPPLARLDDTAQPLLQVHTDTGATICTLVDRGDDGGGWQDKFRKPTAFDIFLIFSWLLASPPGDLNLNITLGSEEQNFHEKHTNCIISMALAGSFSLISDWNCPSDNQQTEALHTHWVTD